MANSYHLAQINIGRLRAPIDDPQIAGFVARLDEINALAEGSTGYVWRLQTPVGNATELRPYDDDLIIVNLSVWETPEALRNYVYRSAHASVMRQRREWFERFAGMYYALWWVPAGHEPSVHEATARLEELRANGDTPRAFSFTHIFPAPDAPAAHVRGFADTCPAL